MRCLERYTIDTAVLEEKPLEEVLEDDYGFDVGRSEESSFCVRMGHLWYNGKKVREVEGNTLVDGNRMFVVDKELEVYELPSAKVVVAYEDCTWEYRDRVDEGVRRARQLLQVQDVSVGVDEWVCNPTRACRRVVGDKTVVVMTSTEMVYMECDGYVASKPHREDIYEVDMDRYEVLGLSSTIDVFELYLALQMFVDLPVDLRMEEKVERFLFRVFVFSSHGGALVSRLVLCGDRRMEMILCRLYRKVDDRGKRELQGWIGDVRGVDALKLIVIYFPQRMEEYIDLCIMERREYEIEELIEHYRGTDMVEKMAQMLLMRNCLYLFCLCRPEYRTRFENIVTVERYNTRSQRNMWRMRGETEGQ